MLKPKEKAERKSKWIGEWWKTSLNNSAILDKRNLISTYMLKNISLHALTSSLNHSCWSHHSVHIQLSTPISPGFAEWNPPINLGDVSIKSRWRYIICWPRKQTSWSLGIGNPKILPMNFHRQSYFSFRGQEYPPITLHYFPFVV